MSNSLLQQFRETSQLSGGNAAFIEDLYEAWLRDPNAVDLAWRTYFEAFNGRSDTPHSDAIARIEAAQKLNGRGIVVAAAAAPQSEALSQKQAGVLKLVTAFRSRGHLAATLVHGGPLSRANAAFYARFGGLT